MRYTIALATALLLLAPDAHPQQQDAGGAQQHNRVVREATSSRVRVRPGNCEINEDDVQVCNDEDSGGNATLDPRSGHEGSETTVGTQTGFEGEITGLDSNDTVDLGSSNVVNVSGTGGTVNVGGGTSVTVTNTNPPTGSGNITVNLPGGGNAIVGPGSSVTLNL